MCSIPHRPENALERAPQAQGLAHSISGSAARSLTSTAVALPMVITVLSLGLAQQVKSQPSPSTAGAAITVQYGYITHHYLTAWEADNLPAGVLRGLPPHSALRQDPGSESLATVPQTDDTSAPPGLSERLPAQDAAILYQLDLGERGMQMMVSAKTGIRPGQCVALERSGAIANLRRVSPAFCDPENQEVIESLGAISAAQVEHCMRSLQRYREQAAANAANQALAEVAMLCDGG